MYFQYVMIYEFFCQILFQIFSVSNIVQLYHLQLPVLIHAVSEERLICVCVIVTTVYTDEFIVYSSIVFAVLKRIYDKYI